MSSMESVYGRVEHPKPIDELGTKTELINQTEVSNFEISRLASTEDVADYLRDTIPKTHLENCPSIRYEPLPSELYPNAKGTFERGTQEICIYGEQFAGSQEMLATLTHEVGHNVHENIMTKNLEVAQSWANLHQESLSQYKQDGTGFVTDYARTNEYEDFADTYRTYIGDPEKLQFYSPEKYEFMKDYVFSGQEYDSRLLGGYYLKDDSSYSWSLYDEMGEPKVLFCCDSYSSCTYTPNGCSP